MKLPKRRPGWGFIALLLTLAAIVAPAGGQGRSSMKAAPPDQRLFDHARHTEIVKIDCAVCHKAEDNGSWANLGKKEHARCFSCHKFETSCGVLQQKEGRACLACHTNFKAACIPGDYVRPQLNKREFSVQYSHRVHIRTDAKSGAQCENCHGEFGVAAPSKGSLAGGHSQCGSCHGGIAPRIVDACASCHKGVVGAATRKTTPNPYSVKATFDHKAHAAASRVGTQARDCLVCHSNIKQAKSEYEVPLPAMETCTSGCHDGKKAFDALGATCTRCHTQGAN